MGGGKIATSSDGVIWTKVANNTTNSSNIYTITYGNGKFVVGGGGLNAKFAYSADGVNWTPVTKSGGFDLVSSIAWGNNKYVAVGRYGKMAYSADGVSWTAVEKSTFESTSLGGIKAIAYGNGRWVAGGEVGKGSQTGVGRIAYSDD